MSLKPTIFPCLRYDDALAAIGFLCKAFGFKRHAVYIDESDASRVHHAELTLNGSMIMLGRAPRAQDGRSAWQSPGQNGYVTMCTCVYVADVDGHCDQAKAAGARILHGPYDNPGYPGRGYDALDRRATYGCLPATIPGKIKIRYRASPH